MPVYMDLSIFSKTRKREIVDKLHSLGHSIMYHRVLERLAEICEFVNEVFQKEKV